jgi:nucleoid DNA-binding protein
MIEPKDIHKAVAQQLNISEDVVDEINRLQYEFLQAEMIKFNCIKLQHIGKFLFHPRTNSKLYPVFKEKMKEMHKPDKK